MSFNRKNAYTNVLECQLVVLKKTINNNAFCTQHLLTKHAHLIVIFKPFIVISNFASQILLENVLLF
jgi:hypothetical protein